MSRNLPEFPNLEHLKKQAKVLLRELQQHKAGAKLADAQHVIARVYGFESWPKLKTHVESAGAGHGGGAGDVTATTEPPDSGGGLFPRFTLRARRVVFFARYWAGKRGSERIETEHLFLGLMEEDSNLINRFLRSPAAHEAIRAEIGRLTTSLEEIPRSHPVPLSAESRRVIECAAAEADRLGHSSIGTGHFLLGFLSAEGSLATSVLTGILREKGIALDKARDDIVRMMNEDPQ